MTRRNGKPLAATALAGLVFAAAVLSGSGRTGGPLQTKLEPYIEIELQRLEETYALIERFGSEIWPAWTNFLEPEFQVQFPNMVLLIVGPRAKVPDGFELVPGRTVRGKAVYLNKKAELPMPLRLPLYGGGGGGLRIRIRLSELPPVPPGATTPPRRYGVSEGQILLYVHEFFHGFQRAVVPAERPPSAPPAATEKPVVPPPPVAKPQPQPARPARPDAEIVVDADYATYSNVEALALQAALEAKDASEVKERLADYAVARRLKQQTMTPDGVRFEHDTQLNEGTALYANTRMALLVRHAKYAGNGAHDGDSGFGGFAGMDDYYAENIPRQIEHIAGETLDTLSKYYIFGAAQCFILDRIAPGWKQGFFQARRTLDGAVADALKLAAADERRIASRLPARYTIRELRAKHEAVIKERDEAIAIITGRKGRRFIVDFERAKEFFRIRPRGKHVRLGVEQFFVNGIESLTLGDVELVSVDTPMHRPWLWTIEWVDTNPTPGEKGYELTCGERAGQVCRGAVLKTAGFTLKAPEVEVTDSGPEVRVVILSKVPR